MAKIVVVKDVYGDWEAVYVDGEVVAQNHSVQWDYMIQQHLIGQTVESLEVFEADLAELGGWAFARLDEFEEGQLTPM